MEDIPRQELEKLAVALGHRATDLFKTSDHDLKLLLMRRGVPIHRKKTPKQPAQAAEEPKSKREQEQKQDELAVPDVQHNRPRVRVFDLLHTDLSAGVDALRDLRKQPAPPLVLLPKPEDKGDRLQRITDAIKFAEARYDGVCVLLGAMMDDDNHGAEEVQILTTWLGECRQDVVAYQKLLKDELKSCRDSLPRTEFSHTAMLEKGYINQSVYEAFSNVRLRRERDLNQLEATLGPK